MYKPCHQEFLLNCEYSSIVLEEFYLNSSHQLENALQIFISELDMKIGNEENWDHFLEQLPDQADVILINDRPPSNNPIYREFNNNTIKAYIYRLSHAGICCRLREGISMCVE